MLLVIGCEVHQAEHWFHLVFAAIFCCFMVHFMWCL